MSKPWKPKVQYLVIQEGFDRDEDAWRVNGYPSLREARALVAYWRRYTADDPPLRVVRATTTYEVLEER